MSNHNILFDGQQIATLAIATGVASEQTPAFDIYSVEGNIRVGNVIHMNFDWLSGTLTFNLIKSDNADLSSGDIIYISDAFTAGTGHELDFAIPATNDKRYLGIQFAGTVGTGTVNTIVWDSK